ncbi:hypothetical protein [Occallatibacter savannae]|uniref:hypothetical protein n=1 Tax=Occallatibacter savannae TaxID=1002691 RepID=UPI0013A56004|nr:hypothetical protein [Occallatibacter savannae]
MDSLAAVPVEPLSGRAISRRAKNGIEQRFACMALPVWRARVFGHTARRRTDAAAKGLQGQWTKQRNQEQSPDDDPVHLHAERT